MNAPRHTCPKRLEKVASPSEPTPLDLNDKQRRFLAAYQQDPVIARAAQLAHINRKSVYRWQANPAFVRAMKAAAEAFFQAHIAKVEAERAQRQRWREQRELERKPMRRRNLAIARGEFPSDDYE